VKLVATVRKVELREDEKGAAYRAELEVKTLDIVNVT
jgi:hypothetical protein